MISTKNILSFYAYYAMWSASGHELMWMEINGTYFVIKLNMAKLKMK